MNSKASQQSLLMAEAEAQKYQMERDKALEDLSEEKRINQKLKEENSKLMQLVSEQKLKLTYEESGRFLETIPKQMMETAEQRAGKANEGGASTSTSEAETGMNAEALLAKLKEKDECIRKMQDRMFEMEIKVEIQEAVIGGFYNAFKGVFDIAAKNMDNVSARMSFLGDKRQANQDDLEDDNLLEPENQGTSKKSGDHDGNNAISEAAMQVISSITAEELAELEKMDIDGKNGKLN